jgi:hypothetical protein
VNAADATDRVFSVKAASKGNKAQGGQAGVHPQKCATVRTILRSKALRNSVLSGIGRNGAAGNGSVGTVGIGAIVKFERATAVETRCGCGMGESSGGYENTMRGSPDRGDRQSARPAMGVANGAGSHPIASGNASNPTIGSGMQQARESFVTMNGDGKPGENPGNRRRKPAGP